MGILDAINGMLNGPRGSRERQAAEQSKSGGMSPITMAILGVLAYKALKGSGMLGGGQSQSPQPQPQPQGGTVEASGSGGLGDLLGGLLGGGAGKTGGLDLGSMLGAGAGGILSGGLGNLMRDLQNTGHGQVADSWISTGANKQIAPNDLAAALGNDTIDTLTQQTGMPRDDLLKALSELLPGVVDQLTTQGRLPNEQEADVIAARASQYV